MGDELVRFGAQLQEVDVRHLGRDGRRFHDFLARIFGRHCRYALKIFEDDCVPPIPVGIVDLVPKRLGRLCRTDGILVVHNRDDGTDAFDPSVFPNSTVAHGSLEGFGGSPFSIRELRFRPNNSVPNVFPLLKDVVWQLDTRLSLVFIPFGAGIDV